MIKLTIDGIAIETGEGTTILQAARENGIHIPTLCYHANLLSIGSCRLCIVEVEGFANPMTSCTTTATEGMVVTTKTDKLFAMRQDYLRLLLAYHPLECPICDAGGECDLQDLVFEHKIEKADLSVARERKIPAYATPLIKYWENRCVLCLRCIHACREVSGRGVLELTETGIDARMAPTNPKSCISCGECLFVCPVGALTENLSPTKARFWQTERHMTTCPHCGFGCTFELDLFQGRYATDVIQDVQNQPNRGSLCILGRFGYDFVNHEAKLTESSSKNGPVSPTDAVTIAYERLTKLDAEGKGIAFVVSPRATNEEVFLIKEIAGRFKKAQVSTSGYHHTGKTKKMFDRMGISPCYDYDKLGEADLIIIAGANLLSNNHVLGDRVRAAVKLHGAKIIVVDPSPTALTAIADVHVKVQPGRDAFLFNGISRRLIDEGKHPTKNETMEGFVCFYSSLDPLKVDSAVEQSGIDQQTFDKMYRLITKAKNIAVIFGSGIGSSHESLKGLLNFCLLNGIDKQGLIMPIARQANALGAVSILQAKMSPSMMLKDENVKGVFFYEEDVFHGINETTAATMLEGREFVAVADAFPTRTMDYADLTVATGVFIEKDGTFFAEDGYLRKLTKMTAGPNRGFAFLRDLFAKLGGPIYEEPSRVTAQMRTMGIIETNGDAGERLRSKAETGKFDAQPIPATLPAVGDYVMVLRDMRINHHIIGKEAYSKGIEMIYQHPQYPVSEDKLFMSDADAARLGIVEGDIVEVQSSEGSLHKPVSIKEGLRPGVLEYIVFKDRFQVYKLAAAPTKWIEVKVRKG